MLIYKIIWANYLIVKITTTVVINLWLFFVSSYLLKLGLWGFLQREWIVFYPGIYLVITAVAQAFFINHYYYNDNESILTERIKLTWAYSRQCLVLGWLITGLYQFIFMRSQYYG